MSDNPDKPEFPSNSEQSREMRRRDVLSVSASWRGPLPPPDSLRAYNEVFPGCAERIVAMAEAESEHRQEEERLDSQTYRLMIQGEIGSERRGMWLAFILAVLMIGISSFLVYVGSLAWGVGFISVELISLVGLFIYGRHRIGTGPSQERPDSQQKLPFPD